MIVNRTVMANEPSIMLRPDENLGLIIIDEQHRFGVKQRLRLIQKNPLSDLLVMSATPIPRSLMLAIYGDMDISTIEEKPLNRLPVKTSIMEYNKIEQLEQSLINIMKKGQGIYWICPAIEQLEVEDPENKDKIV